MVIIISIPEDPSYCRNYVILNITHINLLKYLKHNTKFQCNCLFGSEEFGVTFKCIWEMLPFFHMTKPFVQFVPSKHGDYFEICLHSAHQLNGKCG